MVSELSNVLRLYGEVEKKWASEDRSSDEHLAAACMIEYQSYRLQNIARFDRLIGFRVLVRTFRRIVARQKGQRLLDNSAKSIIISSSNNIDAIIEYIGRCGKTNLHSYLDRDHMSLGDYSVWPLFFRWLPFAVRQAFRCITNPYRSTLALTIAEVVEITFLVKYAEANSIETIYDFLPYEVDSNFMYLVLRDRGIRHFKIPSSGPLATHHRIILSDDVVFSSPYHFEELQKFSDTIRVKNVHLWPPYNSRLSYARYKNNNQCEESNTIGFYSHGAWLRKAQQHADYGGRIAEAEEAILQMLGEIVRVQKHYKLQIFPHPKELRPELKTAMVAHYKSCIGHDQFTIFEAQGGTSQHFAKSEIAIAAFSTVLYERLYSGFKTLIGNMFIGQFPMNRSPLNAICFRTQSELETMLEKFGSMDTETFFKTTELSDYRMEAFPEP